MQCSLDWGLQASARIKERQCECRYMQTSADHLRYSNEGSEGSDELREACRQGLHFARKYNAWLEEAAALQALVQAWQQLVAVAITKRWGPSCYDLTCCLYVAPTSPVLRSQWP